MKAERRHELKENDLVHFIETSRGYLQQNGQRLGLYVVGVVALVVVGTMFINARSKSTRDSWVGMLEMKFADPASTKTEMQRLTALIQDSSDREFILAALLRKGQVSLAQSAQTGAAPDAELLAHAKSAFNDLLQKFPSNPVAFGAVHLGLASVAENEFVLDPNHSPTHRDTAQRSLQAVKDNTACSTLPVYRIALDRLAALDKTFEVVTFAPPLPPATLSSPTDGGDAAITPMPSIDMAPPVVVPPPAAVPPPPAEGDAPKSEVPPAAPPSGGQ